MEICLGLNSKVNMPETCRRHDIDSKTLIKSKGKLKCSICDTELILIPAWWLPTLITDFDEVEPDD